MSWSPSFDFIIYMTHDLASWYTLEEADIAALYPVVALHCSVHTYCGWWPGIRLQVVDMVDGGRKRIFVAAFVHTYL